MLDAELHSSDRGAFEKLKKHNTVCTDSRIVMAYREGKAGKCGAIRPYSDETAEIRRMDVIPENRGEGIALAIVTELEKKAEELGYRSAMPETNEKFAAALHLYERSGYLPIPRYGEYAKVKTSVCPGKILPSAGNCNTTNPD